MAAFALILLAALNTTDSAPEAGLGDHVAQMKAHTPFDLGPFVQDWVYGTAASRFLRGDEAIEEVVARYAAQDYTEGR